jgi:hypothetical protein
MQYFADNKPANARLQEPTAVSITAGYIAFETLRQAYWITGDPKYIKAPEKFFQWMIKASPDRKYSSWYDLQSGRPIAAAPEENGKIYFLDDPKEQAEFMKKSVYIDYARMGKRDPEGMIAQLQKEVKTFNPAEWSPDPDLKAAAKEMAPYVKKIYADRESQNEIGGWTSPGQGLLSAAGNVIWIEQPHILETLKWVEDAKMLTGELPAKFRGRGDIEVCAYPFKDFYDTPLRQKNR